MSDLPLGTGRTVSGICSQGDFYPRDGNSIHPVVILQRRELEPTCRPFSHNSVFRGLVLAVTPKHIQHVHPLALSHGLSPSYPSTPSSPLPCRSFSGSLIFLTFNQTYTSYIVHIRTLPAMSYLADTATGQRCLKGSPSEDKLEHQ